jgi:GDP-D-mannose dehydratase
MKKALITGETGQDGSYLAELLLEKVKRLVNKKSRVRSCILHILFFKVWLFYSYLV